jgi:hypothetical protein
MILPGPYPEPELEGEWYDRLENIGQLGQFGSSTGKEVWIANRKMASSNSVGRSSREVLPSFEPFSEGLVRADVSPGLKLRFVA